MATRVTDAIVKRLPLPATGKTITIDSEVPGFGARVTANGARSYVLRYTTRAGRERTYTIGDATASGPRLPANAPVSYAARSRTAETRWARSRPSALPRPRSI